MARFRQRAQASCAVMLWFVLYASVAFAQTDPPAPQAPASTSSKFTSGDGWFDMSGFLDTRFGFMPIGTVITEPAVGLGAAAGVAFINKPSGGDQRPDMTLVGGFGTDNGSKGAIAGDMHHWLDGRLQTVAGVIWASVNLDYYGLGENSVLASSPLRYNLEPAGVLAQAKYRLGRSALFAGVRYAFAQTHVSFDAPAGTPGLPDFSNTSRVGGMSPMFTLDSRDNLFTPTRGSYVEGTVSFFSDIFGSDDTFQTFEVVGIQYVTLPAQVYLGARTEFASSSSDTPFYMRPFIYQRGVPAMRYLGEEMAQIEGEVRWQFWKRFSAVGFAGTGAAWTGFERVDNPTTAVAGGGGFRYEVARRYGMHVGLDVANGPDGATYYIQWGSAWARP